MIISMPYAAVIGEFDPFHIGHSHLVSAAKRIADRYGVPLRAVVLHRRDDSHQLTTVDQRIDFLARSGIDAVTVIEASSDDDELAVQEAIDSLGVRAAVMACPPSRSAELEWPNVHSMLRKMSVDIVEVPRVTDETGEPVTSELVRQHLANGEVSRVSRLLARAFAVSGVVCHGDERGRTIGFPTANLAHHDGALWPQFGVYAAWVAVGAERHRAAVNIGTRPTVYGASGVPLLEAHLLDYDGDLYGRRIDVHFVDRIRGEQRFDSLDALKERLATDVNMTRQLVTVPSDTANV